MQAAGGLFFMRAGGDWEMARNVSRIVLQAPGQAIRKGFRGRRCGSGRGPRRRPCLLPRIPRSNRAAKADAAENDHRHQLVELVRDHEVLAGIEEMQRDKNETPPVERLRE